MSDNGMMKKRLGEKANLVTSKKRS